MQCSSRSCISDSQPCRLLLIVPLEPEGFSCRLDETSEEAECMISRFLGAAAVLAAAGFCSASASANDTGGLYLDAFAGASMLQDTNVDGNVIGKAPFETGPVVGAALGFDYSDSPFRSEVEFAYRSGDAKTFANGASGDFASKVIMLNGYYDFNTSGSMTPYFGVGVGYITEIDFDVNGGAGAGEYNNRGNFAWQAMGGVDYAVTNRIGLSGELRYFDGGGQTLTGSTGNIRADYASFEAVIGVRYRF